MNKEKQFEYNKWFEQMLQKYIPEWFKYIKDEYWDEYKINYKIIEIPPNNIEAQPIFLKTHGCELTTYYDNFHSHSDEFEDDNHEEEFKNTIDFIKMIMNEEYIFIDYFDNERLTNGSCQHKNEEIYISKDRTTIIKSYNGTYNKMYKPKRFFFF